MKNLLPSFEKRGLVCHLRFLSHVPKDVFFGSGKYVEVTQFFRFGFNTGADYWVKTDPKDWLEANPNNPYYIGKFEGKIGKAAFSARELEAISKEVSAPEMLEILTKKGRFFEIVFESGGDCKLQKRVFVY